MLYTASFYDPQDWLGQAYRVSRAHPRGRRTQWETLPFLYPPLELLRAYRRGELDFTALSRAYRKSLDQTLLEDGRLRNWLKELPQMGQGYRIWILRGQLTGKSQFLTAKFG